MIKTIDQDLFDTLFKISTVLGYDTFDVRPPSSTAYPFVQIGDVHVTPRATKNVLVGSSFITIELFGDHTQRKLLSDMMGAIFMAAVNLRQLQGYRVAANISASSSRMSKDTSVPNTILWHGVIDLEYRIL
ncbi:phage capsid protein [Loigolactobacillus backii]|uniref:phage capsid protein n=1 Tax=Loigolactobacillus backii TaxID=375175 RepID=UPI0022FD530C|nr:phage capsid protein [Loigolactobacillus backii]MDA5386955.1 DUF3168 domain-containing protein [Loigolactobacillus backii]MDA5389493.1 DUF3168 domain-containing protein [Loigolactobacillus backii]